MFDEIFRKLNEGREIKFENIGTITIPKSIGPYTLYQQIGKGSFSVIFNAFLPISSVWNACKIIPKNYTIDKIPIKRFIDEEVKIVQLLNHPNIIKCQGYFEDSECIYVFMPYYENGNLQQLIDRQGGIHILEIKYMFYQILQAVQYLHSKNVCHCDIKPENILLDSSGIRVVLADFGWSVHSDNFLISSGRGTPIYMSPECIEDVPHDGRASDVWSCGILLFTMLTGNNPFKNPKSIDQLKDWIQNCKITFPDFIPPEPLALLKKMLKIDYKKRITVDEALEDEWFSINK